MLNKLMLTLVVFILSVKSFHALSEEVSCKDILLIKQSVDQLIDANYGDETNASFDSVLATLETLGMGEMTVEDFNAEFAQVFDPPSVLSRFNMGGAQVFDALTDNNKLDTEAVSFIGHRKEPNLHLMLRPFSRKSTGVARAWQIKGKRIAEFMEKFTHSLETVELDHQEQYNEDFAEWSKDFYAQPSVQQRNHNFGASTLFWSVLWALPTAFFAQPLYRSDLQLPSGIEELMLAGGTVTSVLVLSYIWIGTKYLFNKVRFKPHQQRALYDHLAENDTKIQRPDLTGVLTSIRKKVANSFDKHGKDTYLQFSLRPYHTKAYEELTPRVDVLGYFDKNQVPTLTIIEYATQ